RGVWPCRPAWQKRGPGRGGPALPQEAQKFIGQNGSSRIFRPLVTQISLPHLAVRIPKLNFVLVLYPSPTHSVWSAGGRSNVCITTQYCSVFSRNPRSCSGVALGAATSK